MKPKSVTPPAHPDVFRCLRIAMWLAVVLLAVFAWPAWQVLKANYAPMKSESGDCQICGRGRQVEFVLGQRVKDEITTNELSAWLDTFVPANHQHQWSVSSSTHRSHWFRSKVIACGGMGVLWTIHQQRQTLGEDKCQQLARKYHELVRAPSPRKDRYQQEREFAQAVSDDPESLLDEEEELPDS